MAETEGFSEQPPETTVDERVLVAQRYNNGMLELCRSLASEEMGRRCCRGQILIVRSSKGRDGLLDFASGTTHVNDYRLGLDDDGYVVEYDAREPEGIGYPADISTVNTVFSQFAGARLLEAFDSSSQDQQ